MKKVYRKEVHEGYEIGKDISIHGHINDPESWFITIRSLRLFGERLCKKDVTEKELSHHVYHWLKHEVVVINDLIKEVSPFN